MSVGAPTRAPRPDSLRHEALLYAGMEEFLSCVVPFVREGVEAGEAVMVVLPAEKLARLRDALGPEIAAAVSFADMAEVGANPARILPAWQAFVDECATTGRRARGVGEPLGLERDAAATAECHRHEALLNLAFEAAGDFWLVCPYDTSALPERVVADVARTHPVVADASGARPSAGYLGTDAIAAPFADPLPRPGGGFEARSFDAGTLAEARRFVAAAAEAAGVDPARASQLMLAVSEVATNSVRHGGGAGVLRVWTEHDTFICEVRDRGGVTDPLAGRVAPDPAKAEGRGLWVANQLCDLVQVRAFPEGGVVRLHMRRGGA